MMLSIIVVLGGKKRECSKPLLDAADDQRLTPIWRLIRVVIRRHCATYRY
jgi:hypothetical protein